MLSRRGMLALASLATLGGCGAVGGRSTEVVKAEMSRLRPPVSAGSAVAVAVSGFTVDLYRELAAARSGNLVCSPYSVAVALGMTLQGARGRTAEQMLATLHGTDAGTFATGLNAIDLALAARSGPVPGGDSKHPQRVEVSAANSLWGQRGITWQSGFLSALAADFGAGLQVVDYEHAASAAQAAINGWVSRRTHGRIPRLVPDGVVTRDTRLTLVNAIYLKAPWQLPFFEGLTRPAAFHRLGGSPVTAQLMTSDPHLVARYAAGSGWAAVELPYAGGQLAMTIVLPDSGRFAEVSGVLAPAWLARLGGSMRSERVTVRLPRWRTRSQLALAEPLADLGMPDAFSGSADLSGMTTDDALSISAVQHEGFIAVDEAGTEAAAATAAVAVRTSAMVAPPLSFVADRPFVYLIRDVPTGTPLFIGRVLDPTAG